LEEIKFENKLLRQRIEFLQAEILRKESIINKIRELVRLW
jgi:hypothetical protein